MPGKMMRKAVEIRSESGDHGLYMWYLSLSDEEREEFDREIQMFKDTMTSLFDKVNEIVRIMVNNMYPFIRALSKDLLPSCTAGFHRRLQRLGFTQCSICERKLRPRRTYGR